MDCMAQAGRSPVMDTLINLNRIEGLVLRDQLIGKLMVKDVPLSGVLATDI